MTLSTYARPLSLLAIVGLLLGTTGCAYYEDDPHRDHDHTVVVDRDHEGRGHDRGRGRGHDWDHDRHDHDDDGRDDDRGHDRH